MQRIPKNAQKKILKHKGTGLGGRYDLISARDPQMRSADMETYYSDAMLVVLFRYNEECMMNMKWCILYYPFIVWVMDFKVFASLKIFV